ncbi:MAG: GYF domain-containing protein [Bradymonadia bacterium]
MKFSCEQCGTRYSIADQKVEGKRLRIRCKVCSFIMDVRGTKRNQPAFDAPPVAEAPVAPLAPPSQTDLEWYVANDGTPVGPISFEQLADDIKSRRVSRDVLVWNETFTDWKSAADVAELARLIPPPLPTAGTVDPGLNSMPSDSLVDDVSDEPEDSVYDNLSVSDLEIDPSASEAANESVSVRHSSETPTAGFSPADTSSLPL